MTGSPLATRPDETNPQEAPMIRRTYVWPLAVVLSLAGAGIAAGVAAPVRAAETPRPAKCSRRGVHIHIRGLLEPLVNRVIGVI